MKRFAELERNCIRPTDGYREVYSFAILGTSATQHIAKAIKGWAYKEKIKAAFIISEQAISMALI